MTSRLNNQIVKKKSGTEHRKRSLAELHGSSKRIKKENSNIKKNCAPEGTSTLITCVILVQGPC
jgi:hypothetical protein